MLLDRGATLAVAESCTGGLVGARVTSVRGSSRYFLGGVIAYDNAVKERLLAVDGEALRRSGAVSAEVARQMAAGVRHLLGADYGIGITGIAGPDGGSARKPVGLVFVAVAGARGCRVCRNVYRGGRLAVRRAAAEAALGLLTNMLETKGAIHGKESG